MSGVTLSKSRIRFLKSLHTKKGRLASRLFICEGNRLVHELTRSKVTIDSIYILASSSEKLVWLEKAPYNEISTVISEREMDQISLLQTLPEVLAVVRSPTGTTLSYPAIACDDIQDPGNIGTIIRVADWFGIKTVILSPACADWQSSKVVQATMGSFARVSCLVMPLEEYFLTNTKPVYGAVLDGKRLGDARFDLPGVLLLGNEGHGVSKTLFPFITHRVTVEKIGEAESLNVGVAAGIICFAMQRAAI